MLRLNNAGSHTWLDFNFGGVSKSHIGALSEGSLRMYISGGRYFQLFDKLTNVEYMTS